MLIKYKSKTPDPIDPLEWLYKLTFEAVSQARNLVEIDMTRCEIASKRFRDAAESLLYILRYGFA